MSYSTCVANIIISMSIIASTDECMEMAYRRKGGTRAKEGEGKAEEPYICNSVWDYTT